MLNISTVKTGEKLIHNDVNGAKMLPIFLRFLLTKLTKHNHKETVNKTYHGLLYLHGGTLRIFKTKIVGPIFKRSFASK